MYWTLVWGEILFLFITSRILDEILWRVYKTSTPTHVR